MNARIIAKVPRHLTKKDIRYPTNQKLRNDTRFTLVAHEISSGVDLVLTDMSSFFTRVGQKIQRWIQDFPDMVPKWKRGANLLFGQNMPKTAWKWRKLDWEGASKFYYVDPPLKISKISGFNYCLRNILR